MVDQGAEGSTWRLRFLKAAGVLMSGNIISQIVALGLLPVLARIAGPEAFGAYGVLLAIIAILPMLCFFGLDLIIIAARDDEAAALRGASELVILLTLLLGGIVLAVTTPLSVLALLAASFSVLTAASFLILTQFALRAGANKRLSMGRVVQAISFPTLGIAFWLLEPKVELLILAFALSWLPGIWLCWPTVPGRAGTPSVTLSVELFKNHIHLVWPTSLGRFVDVLAARLSMLVAPVLFGLAAAGLFSLAMRLLSTPARIMGSTVGDLLYRQLSQSNNSPRQMVLFTFGLLCAAALICFLPLYFLTPWLVKAVLGPEWVDVIPVIRVLILPVALQLLLSPLSRVLLTSKQTAALFYWQLLYLTTTATAVSLAWFFELQLLQFCWLIVAATFIAYSVYAILIPRAVQKIELGRRVSEQAVAPPPALDK